MPLYAKSIYVSTGSFTITIPNDTSKYQFLIFGAKNNTPYVAVLSCNGSHEYVYCTDSTLTCSIANNTTITVSGLGNYSSAIVFSPVAI